MACGHISRRIKREDCIGAALIAPCIGVLDSLEVCHLGVGLKDANRAWKDCLARGFCVVDGLLACVLLFGVVALDFALLLGLLVVGLVLTLLLGLFDLFLLWVQDLGVDVVGAKSGGGKGEDHKDDEQYHGNFAAALLARLLGLVLDVSGRLLRSAV